MQRLAAAARKHIEIADGGMNESVIAPQQRDAVPATVGYLGVPDKHLRGPGIQAIAAHIVQNGVFHPQFFLRNIVPTFTSDAVLSAVDIAEVQAVVMAFRLKHHPTPLSWNTVVRLVGKHIVSALTAHQNLRGQSALGMQRAANNQRRAGAEKQPTSRGQSQRCVLVDNQTVFDDIGQRTGKHRVLVQHEGIQAPCILAACLQHDTVFRTAFRLQHQFVFPFLDIARTLVSDVRHDKNAYGIPCRNFHLRARQTSVFQEHTINIHAKHGISLSLQIHIFQSNRLSRGIIHLKRARRGWLAAKHRVETDGVCRKSQTIGGRHGVFIVVHTRAQQHST